MRVPDIQPSLFQAMNKSASILSNRELEVLHLISHGLSNADIADRLCISVHTVANHRKSMLARSRCSNVAELVRLAMVEKVL
jgi:DNA-binding CsgD family transcriptional regulator